MHFDEAHRYDKKDLKPQDFADNEWHKKDDELFADFTDILDASKPITELNSIPRKSFETYPYSEKSRASSPLLDIPDSVEDEGHKESNEIPADQLRRETEEWSRLQLNKEDRDSSIQLSDVAPKRSRQKKLADPTSGSRQSARIKGKMLALANVMRSVSNTISVPKSHIHMVIVWTNLSARCDISGLDEPLSL